MQEKHIVKKLEGSIGQLLPVPGLEVVVEHGRSEQWDLRVKANYQGLRFDLIVEVVPANNLPIFRDKINRLKLSAQRGHVVPVLAAPYLSPEKQALCRKAGIYFMDLSGNVFIAQRSFYVERIGFPNKYPEKRQRRYPFSDKASLILRELLKDPKRQWGIRELAEKKKSNRLQFFPQIFFLRNSSKYQFIINDNRRGRKNAVSCADFR